MEVYSLIRMRNQIEIIILNTSVSKELNYPSPGEEPYLIRIEGLFKNIESKNFEPAHFTVTLYEDDDKGTWSVYCTPGDTFNFFTLSEHPSERAALIHHCLEEINVKNQIAKDFGQNSWIAEWIKNKCPVTFKDVARKYNKY